MFLHKFTVKRKIVAHWKKSGFSFFDVEIICCWQPANISLKFGTIYLSLKNNWDIMEATFFT